MNDFSPYIYCANSPLNYIDREGKFWELIAGALILNWSINTFNEKCLGNKPGGAPTSISQMGTFQPQMPSGVLKDYFYGDPSIQAGINSAFYFYNRNFGWLPSYKRPPLFLTPQDVWRYNSRVIGKRAGFIWSLPNTLIGFGYVGIQKFANIFREEENKTTFIGFDEENWVWGFENVPFFDQYAMITFGHVVSAHDEWGYGGFNNFTYANHELIHVIQNDIWGPTFFPIYISNWAVNMGLKFAGFNIRPYRDILFERQAYGWENSININLWYYFNPNPIW